MVLARQVLRRLHLAKVLLVAQVADLLLVLVLLLLLELSEVVELLLLLHEQVLNLFKVASLLVSLTQLALLSVGRVLRREEVAACVAHRHHEGQTLFALLVYESI